MIDCAYNQQTRTAKIFINDKLAGSKQDLWGGDTLRGDSMWQYPVDGLMSLLSTCHLDEQILKGYVSDVRLYSTTMITGGSSEVSSHFTLLLSSTDVTVCCHESRFRPTPHTLARSLAFTSLHCCRCCPCTVSGVSRFGLWCRWCNVKWARGQNSESAVLNVQAAHSLGLALCW